MCQDSGGSLKHSERLYADTEGTFLFLFLLLFFLLQTKAVEQSPDSDWKLRFPQGGMTVEPWIVLVCPNSFFCQ